MVEGRTTIAKTGVHEPNAARPCEPGLARKQDYIHHKRRLPEPSELA
uniref:Uncharacterized protein n=1 Tax=Arundo donax TaxID=35708 RepID=A0A0A8YMD3_ARUDO